VLFSFIKEGDFMEDIRCPFCNQLLLRAEKVKGEIKCLRCKNIIKLDR
jgi:phage FluMu protein Com